MSKKLVVVASAVKSESGDIYIGKRHCDCFKDMIEKNVKCKNSEQGFILSNGSFARRDVAAQIAYVSGQIDKEVDILFSEDLW
jgi:hypothetical protein